MPIKSHPAANDAPSVYELERRAAKRNALVGHIDAWLVRSGYNPYTAAEHVVRVLGAADDAAWNSFAGQVGVRTPSAITRAEVLGVFRERVRLLESARREGC